MAKREEFPSSVTQAVRILERQFRGEMTPKKAEFASGTLWFNIEDAPKQFKNRKQFQKAVGRAAKQHLER